MNSYGSAIEKHIELQKGWVQKSNNIINDSSIVSNNAVALKTSLKKYILYTFTTNDKIYDTFNVSV